MPSQEPTHPEQNLHPYEMKVIVYGPVRPAEDLDGLRQRVMKANVIGRDFLTDVTLRDSRNAGGMKVEYSVTALSPEDAKRAGADYLIQLCDLLSVVTRLPVWFYMPEEDSRDERTRMYRQAATIDRILTEPEWSWITGNLVFIRREHPRFLAAASWYRRGLISTDCVDKVCCFWRVIERLSYAYADTATWSADAKSNAPLEKYIDQMLSDLLCDGSVPEILADAATVKKIKSQWDDLTQGNIPVTREVIDDAMGRLKPLEDAAFSTLRRIRECKLSCDTLS